MGGGVSGMKPHENLPDLRGWCGGSVHGIYNLLAWDLIINPEGGRVRVGPHVRERSPEGGGLRSV